MSLLCVGDIAVDILASVDNFPEVNSNSEIVDFAKSYGGSAANTAYIARSLGATVGLVSAVGPDFPQDYYTRLLEIGIDLTHLKQVDVNTTSVFIFSRRNDQMSFFYRGASRELDKFEIPRDYILNYRIVHLCRNYPRLHRSICDACEGTDTKISFNPGYGIDELERSDLKYIIEKSNILFVNEYEMEYLLKTFGMSTMRDVYEWAGLDLLVVTMGKKGCKIIYNGEEVIVPALEVPVVDPTGAGDSFTAGFLKSFIENNDPIEAAKIGSCTAAFVIQKRETQPEISWDDVYALRKKAYI